MLAYYEFSPSSGPSGLAIAFGIVTLLLGVAVLVLFAMQVWCVAVLRRLAAFAPAPDVNNRAAMERIADGLTRKNCHLRRAAIQQAGWCGEAGKRYVPRLKELATGDVDLTNRAEAAMALKRIGQA